MIFKTFPFRNAVACVFVSLLLLAGKGALAQTISITEATAIEGNSMEFVLTLDAPVVGGFTVNVNFQNGNAQGNGSDFTSTAQSVTFTGPAESQVLNVATTDDLIAEGDEDFTVVLSTSKAGVSVGRPATGTITDDDIAHITIQNGKVNEGDKIKFKLKLDKQVKQGFIVNVNFTDGTATHLITGLPKRKSIGDYSAVNQSILFNGDANEEHEVSVQTFADFFHAEGDEYFTASIATHVATSYLVASSTARGIISDFSECFNCPSRIFLDTTEQLNLTFYGDGNLQKTVQSGDDIAATTGIGVHVDKYFKNFPKQKFGPWYRAELMAQINIASSVDTVESTTRMLSDSTFVRNVSSFGNSILTPINSGQAVDLKLRLYNKKPWLGIISGLELRYVGSNRNWKLNEDTVGQINTSLARVIVFHDLIPYYKRNNYSVMLRAGYATNWMRGDLGSKKNDGIRNAIIGTTKRNFHGIELGVGFRLKNILADFAYTILPDKKNVEGLTGSRLVMTIKFVGGFKIELE